MGAGNAQKRSFAGLIYLLRLVGKELRSVTYRELLFANDKFDNRISMCLKCDL